jgi:hypothetical protein
MISELAIDATASSSARVHLRDALIVLGAVVACIYALDAAQVAAAQPLLAGVLLGIGMAEAVWVIAAARRGGRGPLAAGAAFNALLAGLWVLSRTVGLPVGSGKPLPVGVLDALCAIDTVAVAALAVALIGGWSGASFGRGGSRLRIAAVVLATVSLAALHVHPAVGAGGPERTADGHAAPRYHFVCQLL